MVDLDWALANMNGKSKKTVLGSSSERGKEAETKGGNDLVKFIIRRPKGLLTDACRVTFMD